MNMLTLAEDFGAIDRVEDYFGEIPADNELEFLTKWAKDEHLAAYYYQKADQHICLGKEGARWLLNYYRNGEDIHLSDKDLERLQVLANEEYQGSADASEQLEDVDEVIEIVDEDYVEEIEE